MLATARMPTVHERHIDEVEEVAVANGPASLRHLDGGSGDRSRRHSKAAAGDGDGAAAIDAAGIDQILQARVERRFRLDVWFGPRILRRARPWKPVDADVEYLRRRAAEAGI